MERSKLKNIILAILAVTNILLLGLMLVQHAQSRHFRQQVLLDAVELLAQQGISVQLEDLPQQDFPAPQVVERDPQEELAGFTALLGEDTVYAQRGPVSLYTGSLGSAEVREDGSFSITLAPGAYPIAEGSDPVHYAKTFLARRLGLAGQVTQSGQDAVAVTQVWNGCPVFSCQAVLTYGQNGISTVTGTRLPGAPHADTSAAAPLSTATLLVRFRSGIITSGDACTAILSATQGYVLTADANGGTRLTPVLRLQTDTNLYILNALTGELQRG